ncbi:DUF4365 domain-containing protein [Chryseobacterium sp. 3008163]|uniref:DUF4365 domain-containing protein n=1 Tax=Chryseobacterium sp. 3008163 TaxID=2478663 RepID=UPI000F0CD2F7|nr:DUF4365 domain-containing protein [Chryseobacterium sp. 3008163]AYM99180.1 DUF4365 domain-containing protein [Chryseobacterium sp. 3008163]
MNHDINNLNLPKDSRNKQLEIISKDKFRPLFDVERFVVKEEVIDNGIDFRFEVKINNTVTGFGFNFQLKSTENTKQNHDGSYSKNIETSNIEYLLNNGQPAFYAFYIEAEKNIYYTDLKKVIHDLNIKNPKWQDQPNHTIRFSEKLDFSSITSIYNIALSEGQMIRRIQAAFAENFGYLEKKDKIIIDLDTNVVSDSEIVGKIEDVGLLLIDQCRWNDVINLHNQTTSIRNRSAKYSLAVGVSFYYSGEFLRSLDFLKDAYRDIDRIEPYLQDYLRFFYYGLQRIFNVITEDEYQNITNSFPSNSHMFMHKLLEEAKESMVEMNNSIDYISHDFENKISQIINNAGASSYIKLLAKIEFNYYKSQQLIYRLIMMLVSNDVDEAKLQFNSISQQFHDLLSESKNVSSNFAVHFCSLRYCTFVIHFDSIYRRNQKSNYLDKFLTDLKAKIMDTLNFFQNINHVENEICTITLLLEYYQNIEDREGINNVLLLLDDYKKQYGNFDFNKKIDFIKNGGTFVNQIITMANSIELDNDKIANLEIRLTEIERGEKEFNYKYDPTRLTINLFPIGHFQFPKEQIEDIFKILRITDEILIDNIKNILGKYIPVLNCYVLKIEQEGPLNGHNEYQGIENLRNVYRIREELYENEFRKTELMFRN